MNTKINTRHAERRDLSFHCTGCLKEDLAQLEAGYLAGTLRTTGNWSAGENLDHIAIMWEYSLEGAPPEAKVPFIIRLIAPLMKRRATSGKTLPAGFKIPQNASYMMPRSGCSFEDGLARLRKVLDRLDRGEQMTHASPAFGKMSHDEWMGLHLGHAQLHLGFVHPR
jgi:hypothetical protein